MRLLYTISGNSLLALSYNTGHTLWERNESNVAGKASADVLLQQWIPSGVVMINSTLDVNPEEAVPCFALSKNNSFLVSSERMRLFMPPPPAATCIAFYDNNIIAIGMDDSTIQIYNVQRNERWSRFQGQQKRVTSLAFSFVLKVLVSSGADSQLFVWSVKDWKIIRKLMNMPNGGAPNLNFCTRVQFHEDGIHVLAVHQTQVAVYKAPKMKGLKQGVPPRESSSAITDAVYSGGCHMIYVSFKDGRVCVLIAETLTWRCMINPAAYLPSNPSSTVYPVVIAATPTKPNQFTLGLSDGGVHILEPLKSMANWVTLPAADVAGPSASSAVLFFWMIICLM